MCSMIDSGEKGYKLPEQILFNSLVLYLTLQLFFEVNNALLITYRVKSGKFGHQVNRTHFCKQCKSR